MAHIDGRGRSLRAEQFATPLWQGLEPLVQALQEVKKKLPDTKLSHAVTTTGELADCFPDRKTGVCTLVERISSIFDNSQVLVYAGAGGFIPVNQAGDRYRQVASANWHATTQFVARHYGSGVLMDIGSSTVDIVPFQQGSLCCRGHTDEERLRYNELVYSGIVRTPLMAITGQVPYAGEWQPLAAENFACTADIYRLTGELNEFDDMMVPADGGGKTVTDSARRLARMVGVDIDPAASLAEWRRPARYIAEQQLQTISCALHRVMSAAGLNEGTTLVGAGCGRFLVRKLAQRHACHYADFEEILYEPDKMPGAAGNCATAISVAQLARLAEHP